MDVPATATRGHDGIAFAAIAAVIAAVMAMAMANGAYAQSWSAPNAGAWNDPAAWGGTPPAAGGSVTFGTVAGPTPFAVAIGQPIGIGSLSITNQSPIFIGATDTTFIGVIAGASVVGPGEPMWRLERGAFYLPIPTVIGSPGGPAGHMSVGPGAAVSGGAARLAAGSVTIEQGATWIPAGTTVSTSATVGDGAPATLTVGGSLDMGLNTALAVGINGGVGTIAVPSGGMLTLGVSGATVGGGSSAFPAGPGVGVIDISGGVVNGPGAWILGASAGGGASMSIHDGSVLGSTIYVGRGVHGAPALSVEGTVGLGTIVIGSGAIQGQAIVQSGATVHVADVVVGSDTLPAGTTTVDLLAMGDAAALDAANVILHRGGHLVVNGPSGSLTAGSFDLGAGTLSLAGRGTEANVTSLVGCTIGGAATISLTEGAALRPYTLSFGPSGSFAFTLEGGARCEVAQQCGFGSVPSSEPTATTTTGDIVLKGGGSLQAKKLRIERDVTCHWHLASEFVPPTAAAVVATESAIVRGRIDVRLPDGAVPPVGIRIPLIDTPSITYAPFSVASAPAHGFPLVVTPDALGLAAYAIDHVTDLQPVAPESIDVGDLFSMQAILTTEIAGGSLVADVAPMVTWTIEPPGVVAETQPNRFMALAPGTVTLTAHFAAAAGSVTLTVVPDGPLSSAFVLISGVEVAGVTTWGNGDSGLAPSSGYAIDYGLGAAARSLTADGSFLAFATEANNLTPAGSQQGPFIYGRSLASDTLENISVGTPAIPAGGARPSTSGDGRFVVYQSQWPVGRIIVRDRFLQTSSIALFDLGGTAVNTALRPFISDDGRYVLCEAYSAAIVPNDTNGVRDVFLVDRVTNVATRVSRTVTGDQLAVESTAAALSGDGRIAIFLRSFAGHVLAYRYDRVTDQIELATPTITGGAPQMNVRDVSLTSDGTTMAFVATGFGQLTADPAPPWAQAYRRDFQSGTTVGLSRTLDGTWSNAPIEGCAMARGGRYALVATKATSLVPGAPSSGAGITRPVRIDTLTGVISDHGVTGGGLLNDDVTGNLAVSDAGTKMVFASQATNVIENATPADTHDFADLFVALADASSTGDLDGDGAVGPTDLALLLGAWGGSLYDLDGDGSVGASDLALLLGAWSA